MARVLHPRLAPRRQSVRATSWWGKAWIRAVEEVADHERDLVRSRTIARSGRIGQITVEGGRLFAAVGDGDDVWTVLVTLPVLDEPGVDALVEAVAAESGRVAALLARDLPISLVEHAEEAGVELLPYGGELDATCPCHSWSDPCVHSLAVLQQVAWLMDADPLVLFSLRGLDRDTLLARLHARSPVEADDDLDEGIDAALRARRILQLLDGDPEAPIGHLV